jgi:hypothetical protein
MGIDGLLLAIVLLAAGIAATRRIGDQIGVRGDVEIFYEFADGSRQLASAKKNLVVSNGKTILAKLLGGDANYKNLEHISTIAFGTDDTAAVIGQAALVAEQLEKTVEVDYPAFNQVRFQATMEAAEGGTLTYCELGLKSDATGILFSRIVISPITKSAAYKIQVVWTISIQ